MKSLTADTLEGFVGSVLASRYDESSASPAFHRELWELACSDNKHVAVAAPRGHAKSTSGTLAYGLAMLLFRHSKYAVIVSDTEGQAAMFLQNMRHELSENQMIYDPFEIQKNEKGLVTFPIDNATDLIVRFKDGHQCRIVAKGAEQSLRGMLWNGTRPDLILGDDLENDEMVLNKERRIKFKRWISSALMPLMSPRGKFRIWGTVLHNDSFLESIMPDESLKTTIETEDGLKVYSTKQIGKWVSVKYRAHNPDFTHLLWPSRFTAEHFRTLRAEAYRQGIPDTYSQEYLNHPLDESVAYFKKKDFQPMTDEHKALNLTYYIAADLAISEKETADYSVFVIAGMDEYRRLHLVNVVRERIDGREIVDMIIRLHQNYRPMAFGIEEMQVSKAIGPFLREEMIKKDTYVNLLALKHQGKDKIMRAKSIQARLRARSIYFDAEEEWYPAFQDECLKFPRAKHDDQVDAFAYLGIMLDNMTEAATPQELLDELYEEEVRDSQYDASGRSVWTGY